MRTAASKLWGFFCRPLASAQTSSGAAMTPNVQVASNTQASTVATLSIRTRVAASPSRSFECASAGTKAWLNAPSPNNRRNRFGMRKATLKASVSALAPKVEAISRSRTRPVMREARVSSETVEAAFSKVIGKERALRVYN